MCYGEVSGSHIRSKGAIQLLRASQGNDSPHEVWDKNRDVSPGPQYRNPGKSLKRDLNRGPQYLIISIAFLKVRKKVIDSIALLRPPSSDRTIVSQI